ncbi:PQ loop repeat-domain-containing protein [Mycena floridula]|nr:PQ loop repeat-domain-containing protein [Mycena floridula]
MVEFTISDLLGYASIACWLGAQFPQVLENHRLKSCAGLALPFLANWLAGDISNLIGCILTDQLPFQMWLAAYFVTVDCALVTQYFYYQHYYPKPAFVKSRVTRRYSVDRTTSRYRTLSVVGANVAAAAALIVQEAEPSRWPRSSRDPAFDESVSRSRVRPEDDDESFAHMVESFRSERGAEGVKRTSTERYGRAGSMGRYSGMPPRSATLGPMRMTLSTELPADSGHRGRTLRRDIDLIPEAEPDKASRASRRGANLVMLGVFALFSIGSLAGGRRGMDEVTNIGRVVSPQSYSIILPRLVDSVPQDLDAKELQFVDDPLKDHPPHEHPSNPPSGQRVLGRFFAWLCTTLYLTSRLPQIWKNFVRKSVEGLSMYLFLFAFLGNSFYVASIVASPKFFAPPPASTEFIRESIPYLLGSGGTLMFDVTILTQSFLYRPKHHRRQRTRIDTVEEEAGLLSGDSTHNPPRSAAESVVHSRGRTST